MNRVFERDECGGELRARTEHAVRGARRGSVALLLGRGLGPILPYGLLVALIILVACTACSLSATKRAEGDAAVDQGARPEADSTTSKNMDTNEATDSVSAVDATGDPSRKEAEVLARLQGELEAVAARSRGDVGIAVRDFSGRYGGEGVGVGEEVVFRSASLIKVLILAELLRQVDGGKISLEEPLGWSTVGARARSMITVSDNDATNQLIDRAGFEPINALAAELGLGETHLGRKMLDSEAGGEDNYTSARDMITLLSVIWEGELLSPASTRFACRRSRASGSTPRFQTVSHPVPACCTRPGNWKDTSMTPPSLQCQGMNSRSWCLPEGTPRPVPRPFDRRLTSRTRLWLPTKAPSNSQRRLGYGCCRRQLCR